MATTYVSLLEVNGTIEARVVSAFTASAFIGETATVRVLNNHTQPGDGKSSSTYFGGGGHGGSGGILPFFNLLTLPPFPLPSLPDFPVF